MEYLLQEVEESSWSLHAVNTSDHSFTKCLHDDDCDTPLKLHAEALH